MTTYHFLSSTTGELETNLAAAIKTTIFNLRHFHIITLWKYSKTGF